MEKCWAAFPHQIVGIEPGVPGCTPQHMVFFPSQKDSMCGQSLHGEPHRDMRAHIDLVLLVADQEVMHHARLIQVPQVDHVIHTLSRVWVHGAEGTKVFCSDPVFLE